IKIIEPELFCWLTSEEEKAVTSACGLTIAAGPVRNVLITDFLQKIREYNSWLQCDCIQGGCLR
ncbi:hypothetical protein D7X83_24785, partial [Salmonella enterica subsp. enterica serovar Hartford]|nr:hypothetical protein [Salmonella enterica subsp. enterica serovar Hartford]